MNINEDIKQRAKKIRMALFDVDGVLTDGKIHINEHGDEIKTFNTQDGHGLRLLQHYGIQVGVITGRQSKALNHRMQDLKIEHVYQGTIDKSTAYHELITKLNLSPDETSFVGDDIVDLQVMSQCGLSIAVANAHNFVKQHAHWQTSRSGGDGAVREVCELLLASQGLLEKALHYNLRPNT